jgi:hypothetical protein
VKIGKKLICNWHFSLAHSSPFPIFFMESENPERRKNKNKRNKRTNERNATTTRQKIVDWNTQIFQSDYYWCCLFGSLVENEEVPVWRQVPLG